MKQIQFDKLGGPEVLKLVDAPKPELAPGTVLVHNRAIGINFADTLFRQGQYATAPQLPQTPTAVVISAPNTEASSPPIALPSTA